jgi:hypothetical protein
MLIAKTPLAEMLAVIAEHSVTIFTEARASSADHLDGIVTRRHVTSNPDRSLLREACERYFFHRAPAKAANH